MEEIIVRTTQDVAVQTVVNKCKCCCHDQDFNLQSNSTSIHTQTFETDFCDLGNVGSCVEDWKPPEGSNVTVADLVCEVVKEATPQSDYVYDESTNLYYNAKMGYYYDPERRLFYEPHSGTYYSYDEESQSYQFYCQVEPTKHKVTTKKQSIHKKNFHSKKNSSENVKEFSETLRKKRRKREMCKSDKHSKLITSCPEDKHSTNENLSFSERKFSGIFRPSDSLCKNIESNTKNSSECQTSNSRNSHIVLTDNQGITEHVAPCIRVLSQDPKKSISECQLIISCNGAIVGRRRRYKFFLTDSSISKTHARIRYNEETGGYTICDAGSEHGTWVNEHRLSESCEKSQPYSLKHGDLLTFGKCKFLMHIHPENETCSDCETRQQELKADTQGEGFADQVSSNAEEKLKRCCMKHNHQSDIETAVADLVQKVSEDCDRLDYVYDEQSCLYYSANTGYYYDPERHLFYEPHSGTYYSYDEENKSYHFYCHADPKKYDKNNTEDRNLHEECENPVKNGEECKNSRRKEEKSTDEGKKSFTISGDEQCIKGENCELLSEENSSDTVYVDSNSSTLEEGELDESDCESDILSNQSATISDDQDSAKLWPPCIRAIIQDSIKLTVGSLLLITYSGGSIGREKSNTFCVPDPSVSKAHAEIIYNEEVEKYVISDLGSQNGTWVNERRLSETKEGSQPYVLNHGDYLTLGRCKLLLHIHAGNETCDDCEPGQVQAKLNAQKEDFSKPVLKTREEKEKERRSQLKNIKKKFGLENMAFEDSWKDIKKCGYVDRTHYRQKTVGSDNPYEKDEAPSSLSQSISTQNRGYKLLQKMGWSEGQSLGKSQAGIQEPIPLETRTGRAGLGAVQVPKLSVDPRKQRWIKVQERYKHLESSAGQK